MLRINVDKVCYVIDLAMQWTSKIPPIREGGGISLGTADDPGGDSNLDPLIEFPGDPTAENLEATLRGLGGDELADLLALLWLGREEFDPDDWEEACDRADEETLRSDAVTLLMEAPHLADHLIEGLQALGYECPEDTEESGAGGPV